MAPFALALSGTTRRMPLSVALPVSFDPIERKQGENAPARFKSGPLKDGTGGNVAPIIVLYWKAAVVRAIQVSRLKGTYPSTGFSIE